MQLDVVPTRGSKADLRYCKHHLRLILAMQLTILLYKRNLMIHNIGKYTLFCSQLNTQGMFAGVTNASRGIHHQTIHEPIKRWQYSFYALPRVIACVRDLG